MPKDFQKGDKVICLKSYSDQFTKGKIYTVMKANAGHINLYDDRDVSNGWGARHFKLYKPKVNPEEFYNKY